MMERKNGNSVRLDERSTRESLQVTDPTFLTTQQLLRELENLDRVFETRLDGMDRAIVVFNDNLTKVPSDTDKQVGNVRENILLKFEAVEEKFNTIQTQFDERDIRVALQARGAEEALKTALAAAKEALATALASSKEIQTSQIAAIIQSMEEKFSGISVQFKERDERVSQTARTSEAALNAALQAAKEAVGKQTDFFTTTISELKQAFTKQLDALGLLQAANATASNDKIEEVKTRVGLIEGVDRGKTAAVVTQQASNFNAANLFGIGLGVIGTVALLATVVVSVWHR